MTLIVLQGQGSKVKVMCLTLLNQNKGRTVWIRIVKLGTYTYHDKRRTSIAFQGQGSNMKVTYCQLQCYFPLKYTLQAYFAMGVLLLFILGILKLSWRYRNKTLNASLYGNVTCTSFSSCAPYVGHWDLHPTRTFKFWVGICFTNTFFLQYLYFLMLCANLTF